MHRTIICRAKVSTNCLDGESTSKQFGGMDRDGDPPMSRDRTFNGASIVCAPCFNAVLPFTPSGLGNVPELTEGVAHLRQLKRSIARGHDETLREMMVVASEDMRVSSKFSYAYKSAKETKRMVTEELEKRRLAAERVERRRAELREQEQAEAGSSEDSEDSEESRSEEHATEAASSEATEAAEGGEGRSEEAETSEETEAEEGSVA